MQVVGSQPPPLPPDELLDEPPEDPIDVPPLDPPLVPPPGQVGQTQTGQQSCGGVVIVQGALQVPGKTQEQAGVCWHVPLSQV